MFATDLALRQQISEARFSDFLREAERERRAAIAVGTRPTNRRDFVNRARASAAAALLRAGHWVMPAEAPANGANLGSPTYELRLGQ